MGKDKVVVVVSEEDFACHNDFHGCLIGVQRSLEDRNFVETFSCPKRRSGSLLLLAIKK
jgi:hypothetical protein